MNELIHADIFFFVTTIIAVLLALVMLAGLWYVVGILRNLKHISDRMQQMSQELQQDFENLRTHVKAEGMAIKNLVGMFQNLWQHMSPPSRKKAPRERKGAE